MKPSERIYQLADSMSGKCSGINGNEGLYIVAILKYLDEQAETKEDPLRELFNQAGPLVADATGTKYLRRDYDTLSEQHCARLGGWPLDRSFTWEVDGELYGLVLPVPKSKDVAGAVAEWTEVLLSHKRESEAHSGPPNLFGDLFRKEKTNP